MATQRFSLRFRVKKPNNYVNGKMQIYLRITVDSERVELSVNRDFDPTRWNTRLGRAIGTKEDTRSLNAYLDMMQVKVHEAHRALLAANVIPTAAKLKAKLAGKKLEPFKMLLEVFSEHNQQMKTLIEKDDMPRER